MDKLAEKICKHKKLILVISGILLVLSFIGNFLTKVNYDILVYLPKDIETIKGQDILTDDFDMGSYSVAVAENLSNKQILDLEKKIKNVKGVNKVVSLYDAIGTIIPMEMLPVEVTEKLHKDDTDLLFITFYGSTSSEETIDAVKEIRNISSGSVRLGGMSSMVLDTMELSNKEILIYVVIAVALCIVVLEFSLDSYLVPILLLLNIGCAIIYNLGSNILLGEISYITKALVAVLQLGVTTDFSIFLYHSYESKKEKYKTRDEAMASAIKETFTSVIGSSLTTIAGFLVLCTMQLTLGRDLGIVMAKGVLLGVISVLTLFPSMLLCFDSLIEKTKHKSLNLKFEKLNKFIIKNHIVIFIIFLIIAIPAYLGYKNVSVYYKMDRSLPATLESISTNEVLKDKYNIVSPEILLVDTSMKSNDVVDMINEIKNVDGIDFVLSFDELKQLGITDNMISEDLLKVFKTDKYEMILVNSLYEVASDELNSQVEVINNIVKEYDDKIIVAGEGPLMKDLISISDTDFNNVNTSSIVCILVILLLVLKSFSLPILLICAIETAIFINMSFSYFGGVVLPFVAPIVLGTIQLGATIDYAILMTSNYLGLRKSGKEKREAMLETLNYNGRSILVSGLCFFAATFGVGVYSQLEMVGSLCTLISRGAIVSMLVVILVLPSILLIFDSLIMKTTKGCNNMKKNNKKIISLSLAILASLAFIPSNAFALSRIETVYGKLDTTGNYKSVLVTEHLKNDKKENTLQDYTDLKDVLNINGNEVIEVKDNKLTVNSNGLDIFYQGKYDNKLPISMDITYKLDGKKVNGEDILGKSGKVEINIKYTNSSKKIVKVNGKNETLYTPFVVTFGTILDEYASNINVTNGKTISNGTKNVVGAISTPGLYESLNLSELKNTDKITLTYETTCFSIPSMYSVITPKLISSSDLKIFDKLDTLYKSSETLKANMDLIDTNTKKIKEGSNKLKSTLSSSMKGSSKNALTTEQVNMITNQASGLVSAKFTDEYKNEIAKSAWKEVQNSLDPNDSYVVSEVQKYSTNIMITYLKSINKFDEYVRCSSLGQSATSDRSCMNLFTLIAPMKNALSENNGKLASSVSSYVAENVSKSVAVKVSEETAKQTVSELAPTLANTVANQVKDASIESLKTLYNGISTLDSGINELSAGISKYNEEGITKITNIIGGDVKTTTNKVKSIVKLGENYKSVNSKSLNSSDETRMILVVDGKKYEAPKQNTQKTTKKVSFFQRIKNLFK